MEIKRGFIVLLFSAFTVILLGCGGSEKQPQDESAAPDENVQKVQVVMDLSAMNDLSEGDTLSITKTGPEEKKYNLVVRRVQETIPGIMSISALVADRDTGMASLIYRDGQLSGFMDMYESAVRWQINYDSTKKAYYLTEMAMDDIEEMEGGEALTPPNEEY